MDELKENVEVEGVEDTPSFTLRRLKATDIGITCRIVSKIGLNEIAHVFGKDNAFDLIASIVKDKKEAQTDEEKKKIQSQVGLEMGIQIIQVILENYEKCQNDLISFCADLAGKTFDEVNDDISLFFNILKAIFDKPEIVNFCKTASSLKSKLDTSRS